MSAGFDVVNHPILLDKMKEYNFAEETIDWFRCYLTDRSQYVQVESSMSPTLPVPWGVPQGSILGPLLLSKNHWSKMMILTMMHSAMMCLIMMLLSTLTITLPLQLIINPKNSK